MATSVGIEIAGAGASITVIEVIDVTAQINVITPAYGSSVPAFLSAVVLFAVICTSRRHAFIARFKSKWRGPHDAPCYFALVAVLIMYMIGVVQASLGSPSATQQQPHQLSLAMLLGGAGMTKVNAHCPALAAALEF